MITLLSPRITVVGMDEYNAIKGSLHLKLKEKKNYGKFHNLKKYSLFQY